MDLDNSMRFYEKLATKARLKKLVYQNTLDVFSDFKLVAESIRAQTEQRIQQEGHRFRVEFREKSEMEAELRFAGDTLFFVMHTNVFEFPRLHDVMRTPYILEDPERSFSGVIMIYNFLTDSFRYHRENDLGYLVARIFVNKDRFFLVEGKHQTGFYFNQFMNEPIKQNHIYRIIDSAISYSVGFDLLAPPYELIKEISVGAVNENSAEMKLRTGKRLGFKFQADHDKGI